MMTTTRMEMMMTTMTMKTLGLIEKIIPAGASVLVQMSITKTLRIAPVSKSIINMNVSLNIYLTLL